MNLSENNNSIHFSFGTPSLATHLAMSLLKDSTVAVITGTSSNLGFNIAVRLLEGFLTTKVTLVVTSEHYQK